MTPLAAGPLSVYHLCSDYARQPVYPQLLRAIAMQGLRQFMYVPVRTAAEVGVGRIDDDPAIAFRFVHLLRRYHKLMFRTKVRGVLADVLAATPIAEYKIVHAHFLYSDGAVALALYRRMGLPYVVAVRNADVNAFMRYRPDLSAIRNEVLRHASRVVFLSPAYAVTVIHQLPVALREAVASKMMTVPSGLAPDWLDDSPSAAENTYDPNAPLRLLYVGDFTPNKNIAGIVAALGLLQAERPATLTVVGGGGDECGRVQALLDRRAAEGVTCLGRISDRARLKALYRAHDVLVMPSFHETFGLTYIEALSQGVPVVHSRGQGVDGYFEPGTVAAAVNPADARSIAQGVRDLAARLPALSDACRREAGRFDWRRIGKVYRDAYRSILEGES
jgi:glycosyltransferase involved in cell wall biosynthesis